MLLLLFFVIFNDFSQNNYLNIYLTDIHAICSDGRTLPSMPWNCWLRVRKACKIEVICLQRGAYGPSDATAIPKPHNLLPHLNLGWFYLSGTGLPTMSLNGCSGCSDGRTVAVDERPEISFSITRGTLPWQPILWTTAMRNPQKWSNYLHMCSQENDVLMMPTRSVPQPME